MALTLTNIPPIMRKKGWNNGARLMESWFGRASAINPAFGLPDTTTIKMDGWVLKFKRPLDVYNTDIIAAALWSTPKAQAALTKILLRSGVLSGPKKTFGDFSRPVEVLESDHFQHASVLIPKTDPLDDLFAALANFDFHIVASGTVEPVAPGEYRVSVDRVGIYVRDQYEFNDEPGWYVPSQPLGFWDDVALEASKLPMRSGSYVNNADFRAWRTANGKGGDFLVFSDLKVHALPTPWEFNVKAPTPGPTPPAKPPPAADTPAGTEVVVRRGDTLSGLSMTHYGTYDMWPLLWDANRTAVGPKPSLLKVGTKLLIPPRGSFSAVQLEDARRRAPKWKNNEF